MTLRTEEREALACLRSARRALGFARENVVTAAGLVDHEDSGVLTAAICEIDEALGYLVYPRTDEAAETNRARERRRVRTNGSG